MKIIRRKSTVRWRRRANSAATISTSERGLLKHVRRALDPPLSHLAETCVAELIATAHALCFTQALSSQLSLRQQSSGSVETTATITLENWVSGWTVTNISLKILARLPKMSQCDFVEATVRAKTSCFISRLVRANISMNARLHP